MHTLSQKNQEPLMQQRNIRGEEHSIPIRYVSDKSDPHRSSSESDNRPKRLDRHSSKRSTPIGHPPKPQSGYLEEDYLRTKLRHN
jgi:hypothetical protein